jgi:hypothetical protein
MPPSSLAAVISRIVVLLALVTMASAFFILPEDSSQSPVFVLSPKIDWLCREPFSYPISGDYEFVGTKNPSANFTGKVVFYQVQNLETKEKVLKRLANLDCAAFVFILRSKVPFPGISAYTYGDEEGLAHRYPVFEITENQNDTISGWIDENPNAAVRLQFSGEERNPWQLVFKRFVPAYANLLLIFSGVVMVMAGYKLFLLISDKGFQLSIGQIVLWLNLLCLMLRVAWLASNPFAAYGGTPFLWVQFGTTFPFAFCISGALLITLYWHEMIQRAGHHINLFLSKMLIPFFIAVAILFMIEIATVIVRGLSATIPVVIVVDSILYAIIVLFLLIFFIITKIRLSREFERLNKSLNLEKGRKLAVASNIVVGIGSVMVLWLAALIFLAAGKYFWTPAGFTITWVVMLTAMTVLCLLQVLLIRVPFRPWKWIFCGAFMENPGQLFTPRHGTFSSSGSNPSHELGDTNTKTTSKSLP